MIQRLRTPPQVRRDGIRALIDALGVADALRFIQDMGYGHGDYTRDRDKYLPDETVDEMFDRMMKISKPRKRQRRT